MSFFQFFLIFSTGEIILRIIKTKLFGSVIRHTKESTKIYSKPGVNVGARTSCGDLDISHLTGKTFAEAHLVIVASYVDDPSVLYIAQMNVCERGANGRGVIGFIRINIR